MQKIVTFVQKYLHKSCLKKKIIAELESIVIMLLNTEGQHIIYGIYDLMCEMRFCNFPQRVKF